MTSDAKLEQMREQTIMCVSNAYVDLLRMPFSPLRMSRSGQRLLCLVRDVLAMLANRSEEDVQDEHELLARRPAPATKEGGGRSDAGEAAMAELAKIAEALGEADDPFAAWEKLEVVLAAVRFYADELTYIELPLNRAEALMGVAGRSHSMVHRPGLFRVEATLQGNAVPAILSDWGQRAREALAALPYQNRLRWGRGGNWCRLSRRRRCS